MKELMLKTYPSLELDFEFDVVPTSCGEEEEYMTAVWASDNSKCSVSVTPSSTWKEVKRNIDKKLEAEGVEWSCTICTEACNVRVSCNTCSLEVCGNCYVRNFEVGKGIVTCPFCRKKTGVSLSDLDVENGARMIRDKIAKMRCRTSKYDE